MINTTTWKTKLSLSDSLVLGLWFTVALVTAEICRNVKSPYQWLARWVNMYSGQLITAVREDFSLLVWIQPDPPYWNMSGFWLLWPGPTQCSSHHALLRKGFWDQRGVAPEQTLRPRVPVVKRHKHAHLDTDRNEKENEKRNSKPVLKVYSPTFCKCIRVSSQLWLILFLKRNTHFVKWH